MTRKTIMMVCVVSAMKDTSEHVHRNCSMEQRSTRNGAPGRRLFTRNCTPETVTSTQIVVSRAKKAHACVTFRWSWAMHGSADACFAKGLVLSRRPARASP